MTIEIPPDKLHNTFELIGFWLTPPRSTKSDIQSPIGMLSYICTCISPGRIFMQRFLNKLHQLPTKRARFVPSPGMLSDLQWWNKSLSVYNGVSMLRSSPFPVNDHYFLLMLLVSVVSSVAVSSTRLFRNALIQSPFQSLHLRCWPLSLASSCGPRISGAYEFWFELTTLTLNLALALVVPASLSFSRVCVTCGFTHLFMIVNCPHFTFLAMPIVLLMLLVVGTHPQFRRTFFDAASLHYDTLSEYICPSDLFHFECQW